MIPTRPFGFSDPATFSRRATGSVISGYVDTISTASRSVGNRGSFGVPKTVITFASPSLLTRLAIDSIIWGWMSSA